MSCKLIMPDFSDELQVVHAKATVVTGEDIATMLLLMEGINFWK